MSPGPSSIHALKQFLKAGGVVPSGVRASPLRAAGQVPGGAGPRRSSSFADAKRWRKYGGRGPPRGVQEAARRRAQAAGRPLHQR